MGMTGRIAALWSDANTKYLASQRRASDVAGGFGSASKVLRMMLQSGVLAVGAYLVIYQQATAGIIIAGSILSARALAPVDLAIANWRGFVGARQSWKRLTDLLALLPTQCGADGAAAALQEPDRRRRQPSMPPGREKVVVQDVSFSLQAGNGLGIIGPSGSGKSSLARMLVGVWRPARGRIRLDGAALDQWSSESLGQHIGYLPQDVELFAGTVAQNIGRFAEAADPKAIIAAANAAGVHELIVSLPEGYETQVGEGGTALSAGQAQRVALARALFGDPFLVVLDEPNSNLDAEGDEALSRAILGVRSRGGIVVVVAHRPSAIASVDLLLMMSQGRAQAFGPKDEVLARVLQQREAPAARALKVVPEVGESQVVNPPRRKLRADPSTATRLAGLVIVIVLAGGVGGWAGTMTLSGALIAPGSVVVDSNVKKVQHPTGGIVGELRVRDGDRVKQGDIVVRLDDTVTRANLAIVTKGLDELAARKARLESERDGTDHINFPADSWLARAKEPDIAAIVDGERKLFELRRSARVGQKEQLRQRVEQLNEEIRGPQGAARIQGKGNQADRARKGRRLRSVEAKTGAAHQTDRARTLRRSAGGRSRAIGRADRPGRRKGIGDRTADHSDRPRSQQRGRQGNARDRWQDRRIH